MWKIILGLVSVILANILLGAKIAELKNEFQWKKLLKGALKYIFIIAAVSLMYLCSYLNPDIMVANIDGVNVNLESAIKTMFIAGIAFYGYKDLIKLKTILKIDINITEAKDEAMKVIDRGDFNE